MIDQQIVTRLIELGRMEGVDEEATRSEFAVLGSWNNLNSAHWTVWKAITENMATQELVRLAKGLTLAERYFRWPGGSVSAVIWVYQEIDDHGDYELSWNVAEWVVRHTENPYAPFGHMPRRSLFESRLARDSSEGKAAPVGLRFTSLSSELSWEYEQIKERRRLERETRARFERTNRERRIAEHRKAHETKRRLKHEERSMLLQKASGLSMVDKLRLVAEGTQPLDFYPIEFAKLADDVLSSVSMEMRQTLIRRLADRRNGAWRALCDRLQALRQDSRV